jgi:hypothetical protein
MVVVCEKACHWRRWHWYRWSQVACVREMLMATSTHDRIRRESVAVVVDKVNRGLAVSGFVVMTCWWRVERWLAGWSIRNTAFSTATGYIDSVYSEYFGIGRCTFDDRVLVLGAWKQVSGWLAWSMLVFWMKLCFTNTLHSTECGATDVLTSEATRLSQGTRLMHCGRSLLRLCANASISPGSQPASFTVRHDDEMNGWFVACRCVRRAWVNQTECVDTCVE